MPSYGDQLSSIPGRFLRWTLKMAFGYALLVGASGYAVHRAAPQRTTAAWNAFWAKGQSCEVPTPTKTAAAPDGSIVMKGKASAKKSAAPAEPAPVPPAQAAPASGKGIVVYGRDACGITTRMRKALDQAGVPYRYAIIDERPVLTEVSGKLSRIGHEGGFGLPVVSVGEETFIRPAADAVVKAYRASEGM